MSKQPNYVFDTDDELYHHGILGQRWGHRRFQNEDGSWTPEGRERYGEGGARSKSDVQKYKAKVSYNTQKYKANLKSKAKQEKDKRTAKEERNRLKEWGKTERVAKQEQAKIDNRGTSGAKFRRIKNLSDEDLEKAINRLKLQSEYNKQYALATNPDSALAKADRFFDGPTGKFVRDLTVATLPNVANSAVQKVLESNLKYSNKLDREKMEADIEKVKSETKKSGTQSDLDKRAKEAQIAKDDAMRRQQESVAAKNYKDVLGPDYEYFWTNDHELGIRKKKK